MLVVNGFMRVFVTMIFCRIISVRMCFYRDIMT